MPPIEVIINAAGGSFVENETERMLKDAFAETGLNANIRLAKSGDEIEKFARVAVDGSAEIIVAGGGDGTISAVAGIVADSGKTFGVLPLGTLNNFSKDLQIPQEVAEAVKIIAYGRTTKIDLAEVNGRIFINNSSIGLYPRIVHKREHHQRLGHGKWRSALWAALRVFRLSSFLKVKIEIDGKSFVRKTPFLFVGNNEYEMDLFNIGRRPSLDEGQLSVYFLHRGGRWGVIVLLLKTLTGRVKQWSDFENITTGEITIQTRKKFVQIALDGEVSVMETPLQYKILPQALKVIVPKPEENA